MILQLDAIKFNHDPSSATVDAFNIRKDENVFVEAPEWRRGISVNPEDSPAAYSQSDTAGNILTIKASFSCDDPEVDDVDIRALDGTPIPEEGGNVLGVVEARNVELTDGASGFKSFNLTNVKIGDAGVGVHDIVWRWQFRIPPSGPWTDFATSTHRIYTTLHLPQEPWQQSPFNGTNMQLPWAAVLEHACHWAATAQDPTDAATRITQSVNQLGKDEIACYISSPQYTLGNADVFECAAFLSNLKSGTVKLNCTDCATIVSTFANILGSELWQSDMEGVFIHNPIIKIGKSAWESGPFNYHTVAWEEDCDVDNDVFDACLHIDRDANPTTSPHVALLPTDLRFGGLYRTNLVKAGAATPDPTHRARRPIQSKLIVERSMLSRKVLELAEQHFDFDFDQCVHEPVSDGLVSADPLPNIALNGWTELRKERLRTTRHGVLIESLWRSSTGETSARLRMSIYQGATIQAACEWLHHSIAAIHSFEGVRKERVDRANAFFTLPEQSGIIFSVREVVVSIVNVGKENYPLNSIAESLIEKLAGNV